MNDPNLHSPTHPHIHNPQLTSQEQTMQQSTQLSSLSSHLHNEPYIPYYGSTPPHLQTTAKVTYCGPLPHISTPTKIPTQYYVL